jgi:hypothetical protein
LTAAFADDTKNHRHKNGSVVDGNEKDSVRRSQRNGIQPSNEFRMLSMQPDVVVQEPSTSISRKCSSDVDLNYDDIHDADGFDNLGYTAPEILNGGVDNSNYGFYRHNGGNELIANGGKLSLAQSLMNGDLHRSPTRLQYVPPVSNSPHGFPTEKGRTTSPTKRQSPIDSVAAVGPGGRPPGSLRSTPLSVQKEEQQIPAHPIDENNLPSAARGRNLRTTPTVGLTIDEVDRITESRRCTPAVPHTSTTSSDDDNDDGRLSPDIVNRTDFTRDDLELVVAPPLQPRRSMSLGSTSSDDDDETNYDTFTNSDYEYAASRQPRSSDFSDPYRLRMPPPATSAAQPPPPPRRRRGGERLLVDPNASVFSSAESTIDDSFSVDGGGCRPTSAGTAVGPPSSGRSSVDILRAAELLGWGLRVDQLVDVFIDIAALPDGGSGRTSALAVTGGRSPACSSAGGAMCDEHPATQRPMSAVSGSRVNGEKRSSRRSPAESFDRPTSSPSTAVTGQPNGIRPSSAGSSTYSNQSSAVCSSAAAGGPPGTGRRSANGTTTPQLSSSSRPVSSASEADNPYLDAQPYMIATGSRPGSGSSRSTADTFASRTTKTPTPTNRNVPASSPLGMIREDDDAVTSNSSAVPSAAYGRQVMLEEYV